MPQGKLFDGHYGRCDSLQISLDNEDFESFLGCSLCVGDVRFGPEKNISRKGAETQKENNREGERRSPMLHQIC